MQLNTVCTYVLSRYASKNWKRQLYGLSTKARRRGKGEPREKPFVKQSLCIWLANRSRLKKAETGAYRCCGPIYFLTTKLRAIRDNYKLIAATSYSLRPAAISPAIPCFASDVKRSLITRSDFGRRRLLVCFSRQRSYLSLDLVFLSAIIRPSSCQMNVSPERDLIVPSFFSDAFAAIRINTRATCPNGGATSSDARNSSMMAHNYACGGQLNRFLKTGTSPSATVFIIRNEYTQAIRRNMVIARKACNSSFSITFSFRSPVY